MMDNEFENQKDDQAVQDEVVTQDLADGSSKWLKIADDAFTSSTDYLSSSIRDQWERNLYNFHSRDKISLEGKKRKAQIFRPKIRASIRAFEAALAVAMFSNNDLANVSGSDPNNKVQQSAASLHQALLQHRLEKTIPWFATVMGAYQDTHNYGICISKAYWRYETRDIKELTPIMDENDDYIMDIDGFAEAEETVTGSEVVMDEPALDLLPPENFRFSANADWRDPISDSPFLIEQSSMFVTDVMEKMEKINPKMGAPEWMSHSMAAIISAGQGDLSNDITRQAREGNRTDPRDTPIRSEYSAVWIHFNIVKEDGIDMAFYTVGTTLLLSKPVPLEEYYKLGRKTYTIGFSSLEAHRNYPAGSNELGEGLQNATNIIANQRIDNVRLAMNKRYFIKRQSDVDLAALMRNVAGGGVMVDDPNNDVKVIQTPDVTGSSYAEQDRINMDMDEILGTFSPSSVQANRSMNETVGGMNLMSNGANQIQEYTMRIFIETWVEKVLDSLVKLEQMYETDETVFMVAANKAGVKDELLQMAGSPQLLDKFIQQNMIVSVNVGMGNTNPEQKMQRLMMAANTTASFPGAVTNTDWEEIAKEVWSYAGMGDGERFMLDESKLKEKGQQPPAPEVQIAQMKQKHEMEMLQMKLQAEGQAEQMRGQVRLQERQMEEQTNIQRFGAERELELIKIAEAKGIKLEELRVKVGIESSKIQTDRDVAALKAQTFNRELSYKISTGNDGI